MKSAPSPFELWAAGEGYDTAPAVSPIASRVYADRDTQAVYDAWIAGARHVVSTVEKSTLDTETLREELLAIAASE